MIVADREYVTSKYKLHKLKDLENLVADAGMLFTDPKPSIRGNNKLTVAVQINIPFNNPITGFVRFLTLRTLWKHTHCHWLTPRIVRFHPQGWYPCQGYPEQPVNI